MNDYVYYSKCNLISRDLLLYKVHVSKMQKYKYKHTCPLRNVDNKESEKPI